MKEAIPFFALRIATVHSHGITLTPADDMTRNSSGRSASSSLFQSFDVLTLVFHGLGSWHGSEVPVESGSDSIVRAAFLEIIDRKKLHSVIDVLSECASDLVFLSSYCLAVERTTDKFIFVEHVLFLR